MSPLGLPLEERGQWALPQASDSGEKSLCPDSNISDSILSRLGIPLPSWLGALLSMFCSFSLFVELSSNALFRMTLSQSDRVKTRLATPTSLELDK